MKSLKKNLAWQIGLGLLILTVMGGPPVWAQDTSAVKASLVVKVVDRDRAADFAAETAEGLNGFFTQKSELGVKVVIPVAAVESYMATAAELGEVVSRKFVRKDLARKLVTKRAALKVRLETQQQYEALMADADIDAVLYVEKELIKLVSEIETLKGTIRYLENRIANARVHVAFEYQDRPAPKTDGWSSFAWLNTMNLAELLEDF